MIRFLSAIFGIFLGLFAAPSARATPALLTWGVDKALTPAGVCLYYLSGSCFSIGTMSAAGVWTSTGAGVFTTLSASGQFSLLANTKYSQPVLNPAGVAFYSPVFNVMAAGAIGDGTADDTTAVQTAATAAAAAGGQLYFPCATFKITTAITVTVPAGKNFTITGGGTECTIINATGAIGGFVFNYGNQFSSVTATDFTLSTNQAGGTTAMNFVQPASIALPAYIPPNLVQNVSLRGVGGYQDATNYWGIGVNLSNVSNTNIINYFFSGKFGLTAGDGLKIIGLPGSSTYAVVLNVIGSTFNNCANGLIYGSFVQGVTVNQSNFTGCAAGIATPAAATGTLAQLDVTNSQFGLNSIAAISLATNIVGVGITNNLFIFPANTVCILLGGTEWQISGNQFSSTSTTGNFAIDIIAGAGVVASSRGVIGGNAFFNMSTAINVDPGATANIGPNSYQAVTTKINDNSGTAGFVKIADFAGANNDFILTGGFSRPAGRLTLTTGAPVMTSTVTGSTSVFYTPYAGNRIPLPNATGEFIMTPFAEVSQATTDTTKSPAAVAASSCYDIFVWRDAATIRATRGPVWDDCTTRSAGSALERVNGLLVNSVAITNGPGVKLGVWVGAIASNAGSTIDYIFGAAASGGTAGVLNVCNYYNQVSTSTSVKDNGSSYTYATATIRQARASAGNQITFMACSSESPALVSYMTEVDTAAVAGNGIATGVGFDSTTTFGLQRFVTWAPTANAVKGGQTTTGKWASGLGKHILSANETVVVGQTHTLDSNSTAELTLTIRN